MVQPSIPADTEAEIYDVQVRRWRAMSIEERVALIEQLHADVESIAIAGIRATAPGISERELRHELARRRYGADLADEVYGPLP